MPARSNNAVMMGPYQQHSGPEWIHVLNLKRNFLSLNHPILSQSQIRALNVGPFSFI